MYHDERMTNPLEMRTMAANETTTRHAGELLAELKTATRLTACYSRVLGDIGGDFNNRQREALGRHLARMGSLIRECEHRRLCDAVVR
jgi:hypothetical protein